MFDIRGVGVFNGFPPEGFDERELRLAGHEVAGSERACDDIHLLSRRDRHEPTRSRFELTPSSAERLHAPAYPRHPSPEARAAHVHTIHSPIPRWPQPSGTDTPNQPSPARDTGTPQHGRPG